MTPKPARLVLAMPRNVALYTARTAACMSVEVLAERSHTEPETVRSIEDGSYPGSTATWDRMAAVLGVDTWALTDGYIVARPAPRPDPVEEKIELVMRMYREHRVTEGEVRVLLELLDDESLPDLGT